MTPSQLEQLLLLEQSGELSQEQQQRLENELATSPAARHQREELRRLAAAVPTAAAEPAPDAAARIAARLELARTPSPAWIPVWKPVLAAAAALALLFGIRTHHPRPAGEASPSPVAESWEWTDPLDAEFAELESLMASIDTQALFDNSEL